MKSVKLGEYIKVLSPKTKIQAKKFLASGRHPIVSQEASYINGYWDNSDDVMILRKPVVIFGDHTRAIKYIDFDFVAGADGTKILVTPDDLDARYFYHWLLAHPVEHLGYARHFRLLKDMVIDIPSLEEQRRIVARLDAAFEKISAAEILTRQNLDNVSALQKSILDKYLSASDSTRTHRLADLLKICHGKDWKSLASGAIPVYGSGGFMGKYVDTVAYDKPTVLLPRKGTITNIFYLEEPFWNVDTVFYTKIDTDKLMPRYFYYFMQTVDLQALDSGSGRPSLTQTALYEIIMSVPSIAEQTATVAKLDDAFDKTRKLESEYQKKLAKLAELRQSLLAEAFSTTNTV